jgi:glycogen debranching enzyme
MSEDKDVKQSLDLSRVPVRRTERLVVNEPLYPILSIDELPPMSDQRDELPHEKRKYLRPEEKVVHIHEPEHIWPRHAVTAHEVLMKARQPYISDELGRTGSIIASVNIGDDDSKQSKYQTEHGRDALEAANHVHETQEHFHLLKSVVISLAESQGVENEEYVHGKPHRQERVGSIILVNRHPEDTLTKKFMRRLEWGMPFYGSVDAPAKFVNAIHRLHTENRNFLRETKYVPRDMEGLKADMSLAFERSVQWLVDNSEQHNGMVAYKNPIKGGGIRNQGWRDSSNAMVHQNGEWANDQYGIAPIEVQGEAFDAFQNAALVYRELFKDNSKADELDERAWHLFHIIKENGFRNGRFVSGFDWDQNNQLRPIDTTTSAAGRFLGSKIAKLDNPEVQEMVEQTILRLFKEDMLTKWGLRTVASSEEFYVPWVYHNGVWKYDTDDIGANLSDLGYFGLDRILSALTTAQHKETGVFYEHVSGDDSEDQPVIPGQDIYVFNELYRELYLWMQAPPAGQTWSATSEIAKITRLANRPHITAIDPKKLALEKKIWEQLPDHIRQVVSIYEPNLAIALSR